MDGSDEEITAFDAAAYIHEIVGEMAGLARRKELSRVAACLALAQELAQDAMLKSRRNIQPAEGKAAPDDAA